ncbi:hypothetical protein SAMN06272789_7289 [Streptomyces sp. 1331.2]|nr:hypothetical protein SAMN06272789_7289 [Streptomyces sp. 1331.2]
MQAIRRLRGVLARAADRWSAGSPPSDRRRTTSAVWCWGHLLGWYVPTVLVGRQPPSRPSTTESATAAVDGHAFERNSSVMRSAESVRGKHRRRRGRIGRGRRPDRPGEAPGDGDGDRADDGSLLRWDEPVCSA